MSPRGRTVLLLGGGRWGCVHALTLSRILAAGDRVVWVSRQGPALAPRVAAMMRPGGAAFDLRESLGEALEDGPDAAVIATTPSTHADAARACLNHGIHVFVEKPLCLRAAEARELVTLADGKGLVLAVGLHLFSATYLHHLRSLRPTGEIAEITIQWLDPEGEIRHGQDKRGVFATTVAHDVYPHIWSVARLLSGCAPLRVDSAAWHRGGMMTIVAHAPATRVTAYISRRAEKRRRAVEIAFKDGGWAALDFSTEPGIPLLDGVPQEPDPAWTNNPSPVAVELTDFLVRTTGPQPGSDWLHSAAMCIDSVVGSEALGAKFLTGASRELASRPRDLVAGLDPDILELAWEALVPVLIDRGWPGDATHAQKQLLVTEALRLHGGAGASGASPSEFLSDESSRTHLLDYAKRVCRP